MTDIPLDRIGVIDTTSAAAKAHVRARYGSEARFKAYGVAAIAFAALFLVVLIADIVFKAVPAFTISSLRVEVPVAGNVVNPNGSSDPTVIGRGDFVKSVRESLYKLFPEAAQDRKSRKVIQGLLSNGAADDLRKQVMEQPSLIGTTVATDVLLSDDADLYLKGISAQRHVVAGTANATASGATGKVTIFTDANVFATELQLIKSVMSRNADELGRQAERASANVADYERQLAAARAAIAAAQAAGDTAAAGTAQSLVTKLETDVASLKAQVFDLTGRAKTFADRFAATGGSENLDPTLPSLLVSINGGIVRATSVGNDRIEGDVLVALTSAATAKAADWSKIVIDTPEASRKITDAEIAILEKLAEKGLVRSSFNWLFFSTGDSREAELAGILSSLVGTIYTMLVTLVLCLPIGVLAAVYLEEFAPKNRFTDLVEVNINNLAAVPSIVFGLLGLAVFINAFGLPVSSPLVGGLVLALLVLPTIIITSRAALKSVPPSIREAALGIGASKQQAVFDHVLPLAMPGVLTGAIIGMAHALGETAPLLMIGMVAFIVDVPQGVTQPATVLPVQIFLWSDLPEVGFQAKTAAAILVLLAFLFTMNGLAIVLRRRFERRW